MKKVYLLPNVITAFALSCGLFVIFKISMTPIGSVDYSILLATAGILLLAVFADLLDGAVARAIKAESEFGGFFDSFSDAITFGVCPSVIVLKTFSIDPGTKFSFLLTTSAMVFSVCGVLRLVRFNISNLNAKKDVQLLADHNKNFTGLPIPAAALGVVSINLFLLSSEFQDMVTITDQTRSWLMFSVMITLGYFMISRWKFPSLKTLRVRVASFQVVFLTVLSAVLIFYGLLHHFPVMFFLMVWLYIVVSWILSIVRLISGKRSKTLVDFEPDEDDLSDD